MSGDLEFAKMHGAGNDFVVLDGIRSRLPRDLVRLCRRLADRHFGVGADQVLVLERPELPGADFRMDIYNQSGERVEMCGNGIRALFVYLRDHGYTDRDEVGIETLGGLVRPRWLGDNRVRVDMGRPEFDPARIPTLLGEGRGPVLDAPLELPGCAQPLRVSSMSMGNPHAVVEVDDVDAVPLERLGPAIGGHAAFPKRVNVEFIQLRDRGRIRQRTWERGVGETLACGSGACAAAVTGMLRGALDRQVAVELRGGTLEIAWPDDAAPVFMTGPAAHVFTGRFSLQGD